MNFSHKVRAKIIVKCYKYWNLSGKKVLDVGCGNAVVSKVLIDELDIDLVGTDVLDYRKEIIQFKLMQDKNKLPFQDKSFDYVLFNDILHHTDNVEELLLEANRISDNIIVFEDKGTVLMKLIDIALNQLYCSKMYCPLNFKTEEEWHSLFSKQGFNCEKGILSYPFWYPLQHMAFKLTKV